MGPHHLVLSGEVPAAQRRPGTAGPGRRAKRDRLSRQPDPAACALRAQASPPFFNWSVV